METSKRAEYVARDTILKLLSDQEIARISVAEESPRVTDGEEYLDLEQIGLGVQRGMETPIPVGRILARTAVRACTWDKILSALDEAGIGEEDTISSINRPHDLGDADHAAAAG